MGGKNKAREIQPAPYCGKPLPNLTSLRTTGKWENSVRSAVLLVVASERGRK